MSVEFRNVAMRYGTVTVVSDVSFTVEAGTLVTLLGPSGCGKTTTLRMIAGLELPSDGRVLIGGRDVTSLSATERDVSMVFQSYALFPHMSVLDNVCYGLRRSGVGKAQANDRARDGLRQVGLEDLGHRVTTVSSSRQALETLVGGEAFDLVITDHAMPTMTGIQLVEEIGRRWPDLPVLLATAFAELPPGIASHVPRIAKPYFQHQLAQAVAAVMPPWAHVSRPVTADEE